jgi:hypothetical protein
MAQVDKSKSVKLEYEFIKDELEHCHNLMGTIGSDDTIEYMPETAGVAARYMHEVNEKAMMQCHSFGQQYIPQKGLKMFGDKGMKAVGAEMGQLHYQNCFEPLLVSSLTVGRITESWSIQD